MSAAIKENKFLETANVFGLNMYGTSFSAILNVLRQKQIPLLDIDIEGAKQVCRYSLDESINGFLLSLIPLVDQKLAGRPLGPLHIH